MLDRKMILMGFYQIYISVWKNSPYYRCHKGADVGNGLHFDAFCAKLKNANNAITPTANNAMKKNSS